MAAAPVREILVATDFSDEAEAALRHAVEYARRFGARLHLLHVFSPGEVEVTRLLADAAALAAPDVPVIVSSTGGDPAEEILRYAQRHPIDLIIMGSHGRSGFSRLLLGSIAERVLREATRPVLTVPSRALAAAPGSAKPAVEAVPERTCLVCATPTRELICAPCRARIRGEALDRKQREERAGRVS
jgi:nucleotide-binding universal stress UspA family protein